jgi:hypothetical protein
MILVTRHRVRAGSRKRSRSTFLPILVVAAICSCGGDEVVGITRPDVTTMLWSLTADAEAVTVGIGGTQQVVATPRNVSGDPIPGLSATFRSGDTTKVKVDQTGVISGVAVTAGVPVIASLTVDQLTLTDTTMVAVTADSRTFDSIQIAPLFGTLVTTLDVHPFQGSLITYRATDDLGANIAGLAVAFKSLDPRIALVSSFGTLASVRGVSVGTVDVVVSSTSYGVTRADTVAYTVVYPRTATVNLVNSPAGTPLQFNLDLVIVGVNAVVTWNNQASTAADTGNVTFDNGGVNVEGGHIPVLLRGTSQARTFLAEGTYTYRNTYSGRTGTVIVRRNP